MWSKERESLKGNLAFMPLLFVLKLFGFCLDARSKSFQLIHTVAVVIVLLLVSPTLNYDVNGCQSVVVAVIGYISSRCIYLTLIILCIRNVLSRRNSWQEIFKRLDNIDLRLQTTFNIKIKGDNSKWFVRVMLVVLFIVAFCSFTLRSFVDETFNVGQLILAMLVFILSVKITFYCMLCASIKLRFETLIKYLKDIKSTDEGKGKIVVSTKISGDMTLVREISSIYDEVLEIILLMNDSFSTLLSFGFGEFAREAREMWSNESCCD